MSCLVFLSAETFWGFIITINMNEVSDLTLNNQSEFIQNKIKNELKEFLLSRNLQILAEKVDMLNIHLHDLLKENETNYACDHCHGNKN